MDSVLLSISNVLMSFAVTMARSYTKGHSV
jgi:hypothetical protein